MITIYAIISVILKSKIINQILIFRINKAALEAENVFSNAFKTFKLKII